MTNSTADADAAPASSAAGSARAGAVRDVFRVLREQDAWRAKTLNMIASENTLSPLAMAAQNSDFNGRYAEGHPGARYYEGTKHIDFLETRLEDEVRALFRCRRAEVRAISGTVANDAVFSMVVPKGSTVLAHGVPAGGHVSHQRYGALGKVAGTIKPIPRGADGVTVNVAKCKDLLLKEKPSAIVLGRSLFLFPEPLEELVPACRDLGVTVLFDAAHVLGLVAGGEFQDPLREGADIVMGSTHKTFFGPQRGLVVSDTPDDALWKKVDRGVFPGCTSNHHLFTLPAMLVATLEFREFGAAYARDVVRNAQAFAKALHRRGVPVVGEAFGFTRSHQVAVDCSPFGGGKDGARRLCESGIVANSNMLPGDDPKSAFDPRGIRFGVQEMTRFGATADDMDAIADLVDACLRKRRDVAAEVKAVRGRLDRVRYTFDGDLAGK
jgi:glycine hydroxymethyltransferase